MLGAQQRPIGRPRTMDRCYRVAITFFSVILLLALTTYLHYEYSDDRIVVPKSKQTRISLDVANIFQDTKPSTAARILLESNTRFFGSIYFSSTNKTIICKPQISFSDSIPAIMSLNLNCFDTVKEKDSFWVNFAYACSKASALLLFIYMVMWWNYYFLAEGSFLWGTDRPRMPKKHFVKILSDVKHPVADWTVIKAQELKTDKNEKK